MSRCFPFPPPGYEKKGRTDEVDLLKKEKQREKKHKKEKRESKERREKEGKDGKHKDKKDKKEKHRDKKKDRDKEKDEDKNKKNTADENGFPGQTEGPDSGKLIQKEIKQKDRKGILLEEKLPKHFAGNNGEKAREKNNHLAEENKDSKFLQELGRRIKEDDGGAVNQSGQELGRRIKEEDGRAGNQLVQKYTFASQKKDEGTTRPVAEDSGSWLDGKEKIKDKSIDVKKIDGQGVRAEARPIENATDQNHAGNFHSRVGGTPRYLEKNFNRAVEATVETRETSKEKKDNKSGDKRKDREKEKKGHGKDKDRDKEKKKEEKVKEQTEQKNTEQNKFKMSTKGGPMSINSFPQITKNSHDNAVSGENLKKRKDTESNGILHASDNWSGKVPRPSSSPHPFTENGRTVKPCQSSIPHASDGLVAATNFKVENKKHKKNGIIGAQPFADFRNKPISATVPADPVIEETSTKPPHPDSKYLSRVYSVPKMDEQPDFDDQDWLFGSHSLQEKKPMSESSKVGGTAQVWAEALHIEPDVYALPYVVPY
ncbi:uncharacterized protein LOC129308580 isoform X2 [Prosopis cineraria]|uniref:uncharacterized protein LOC129308580 isoform X2 n=1 Tax=Prosopis cineraria TaxID=364024 RepID=UPI00241090EF|nr:uncharacterized protein LOC129308580 isoform X2 [Prosopis cineraria]